MKYLLVLVLGVVLGGVLAIFLLGTPRLRSLPGQPVGAPDPGGDVAGTAQVVLNDKFFEALLGTVFNGLGPPQFKLSRTYPPPGLATITPAALQGDCTNALTLAADGSNVKTGVRFAGGKITAPLAFSGSLSSASSAPTPSTCSCNNPRTRCGRRPSSAGRWTRASFPSASAWTT